MLTVAFGFWIVSVGAMMLTVIGGTIIGAVTRHDVGCWGNR